MESFSAEWLALREPADHAARAHDVTAELSRCLGRRAETRVIDLGSGTGSNVRYLLPRLPHMTHWTLVDHDASLLEGARRLLEPLVRARGAILDVVQMDLADLEALPLEGCALVTASALLDLVSADWLGRFARRCRESQAHVLAVLNYDGRIACDPRDRDDDWIRGLVNAHQRTDKGFGPALGPAAIAEAEAAFADCETLVSTSDWRLGAEAPSLQASLVEGWARAAREIAPEEALRIDAWRGRRVDHLAAGRSSIVVGHLDLAVVPPVFGVALPPRGTTTERGETR
jgi:SAM-dependent methyltransferase